MAAIITEKYRKNLCELLEADVASSSNSYYIALGKSDEWYEDLGVMTAPFPSGSELAMKQVLTSIIDIIKMTPGSVGRVIPNMDPLTNSYYYKKYNPYDSACFYQSTENEITYKPCYFIEPINGNVFLIINAPYTPAQLLISSDDNAVLYDFVINGSTTEGYEMLTLANGYTLVCIGKIIQYSKFNSEQFVEISTADVAGSHAYRGKIYGFHIANGGAYTGTGDVDGIIKAYCLTTDYSKVPLDIPVKCKIENGSLVYIRPSNSYFSDLASNASGLAWILKTATLELIIESNTVTKTTAPTIYPCISNADGFKHNLSEYTPSWYICFIGNSRLAVNESYTSYSQVSLIKNPISDSNGQLITSSTANLKKKFVLTNYDAASNGMNLLNSYYIIQTNESGDIVSRLGVLDSFKVDESGNTTFYYLNSHKYGMDTLDETHFISFINVDDNVDAYETGILPIEVSTTSILDAEVLFIDNRTNIDRSEDQNEELKIIIQL